MRERIPTVYILATGFYGTLYTGVTPNLVGRMMQHRAGALRGYTKKYSVMRLVYYEVADTMEVAIRREKQVKRYKREWKRNLIERQNPAWNDLAVGLGLEPLAELRPAAQASQASDEVPRHPGPVPGSSEPQAMPPEARTASPAEPWTPEQVRGDGGRG